MLCWVIPWCLFSPCPPATHSLTLTYTYTLSLLLPHTDPPIFLLQPSPSPCTSPCKLTYTCACTCVHCSIALTQVRQQRALEAASESAGSHQSLLSPEAIPGILLQTAMLNLFSEALVCKGRGLLYMHLHDVGL